MVEVLWERHIGSVMFYLLHMAHKRRQACPSVVVKEKQWSFSEKGPLGYGRTLIAYAGSRPPRHGTSTYDGPCSVFTSAILKNQDQPFYNLLYGMLLVLLFSICRYLQLICRYLQIFEEMCNSFKDIFKYLQISVNHLRISVNI